MPAFPISSFKPSAFCKVLGGLSPALGNRRLTAEAKWHFAYEAAQFTHKRARAPQNINPNDYQKQRDRLQLMREAEDLENNFAPAKLLNKKYATYVAPTSYHPDTGDSELDKYVAEWLNEGWFPYSDVTNRFDFFKQLWFGVIGKNRGGDYGFAYMRPGLTDGMSPDQAVRLPLRIQSVEPDRIGGIYQNVVSENYVSGVILGIYGEPVAYRVYRRSMVTAQYTDPVDVPADQFVHYTDPLRIDMYRSVTMLDTGAASVRDLYEMIDFIKGKMKLASAMTALVNSNGSVKGPGALDPYDSNATPNGQTVMQQDIQFGMVNHLTAGADFRFYDPGTPGPETVEGMKLCLNLLAMSYNLPYSFAIDASALGGASSRLEFEMAKAEFGRGRDLIEPKANMMKNAAIVDGMAKGRIPLSRANVFRGHWGYRSYPQPDLGKEAAAAVRLRAAGLLNPISWWKDQNENPDAVIASMKKWYKMVEDASAEVGAQPIELTTGGVKQAGTAPGNPLPSSPGAGNNVDTTKPNRQLSVRKRMKAEPRYEEAGRNKVDDDGPHIKDIWGVGGAADKTFKKLALNKDELRRVRALVDALHYSGKELPIEQAVAAAYKITKAGKNRLSQESDNECMKRKVRILINEGYPQKQAVAIAYKYCRDEE